MNDQVRWRLDCARDLAGLLPRRPRPRAVVVGGSVARGLSDVYSAIERMLWWDRAPETDVRAAIMAEFQAEYRLPEADCRLYQPVAVGFDVGIVE